MYFADNHVSGMLWNMKEVEVKDGIYFYLIPQFIPFHFTSVVGEWVPRGNDNYFLVHSWNNSYVKYV